MKPRLTWTLLLFLPLAALAQHEGHGAPPPPPPAAPPPGDHAAHGGQAAPEPSRMPEGYAEIQIPSERQQLIGLKLGRAERARLTGSVRASAVVQPDETREAHVHTKLMGWVQELYVNAVGQEVKKGQPLYSLYSQDLYAAQQEYLRAGQVSGELATAARRRLRLWDVPEDQVNLIRSKGPLKAVTFRSPISGIVLEKGVLKGHYVEPGAMLFRIADLSRVWIIASAYEFEVDRLQRGGTARVTVQGLAEPLEARVDYVYPTVDPTSRTVKVRLVADNRDGRLRPSSFATVELPTAPSEALWVPEEAVIDTGVRQVVFVSLGEGRFRPVLVRVGRRAQGRAEILAGLREGAEVATSAQFLLDSESRLRGAPASPTGHGGH